MFLCGGIANHVLLEGDIRGRGLAVHSCILTLNNKQVHTHHTHYDVVVPTMKPTSWNSVVVVVILLSFTGLSALALSFDYIVQNDCAEFSYLEQSLSNVYFAFAPHDVFFSPPPSSLD